MWLISMLEEGMLPTAPVAELEQTLHDEFDVLSTSSLLLPIFGFKTSKSIEKNLLFQLN